MRNIKLSTAILLLRRGHKGTFGKGLISYFYEHTKLFQFRHENVFQIINRNIKVPNILQAIVLYI